MKQENKRKGKKTLKLSSVVPTYNFVYECIFCKMEVKQQTSKMAFCRETVTVIAGVVCL